MPERVREIWDNIVNWWKHFTRKQQMIIVSSTMVVIISIGILAFVLSRPEKVVIKTCENIKEAASVKELLDEAGIYNEVSDNGLIFTINKKDSSEATMLLGSNSIATDNPELKDILNGSLSTTESDKTKLYKEYLENQMETDIEKVLDNVDSATVTLQIPNDDGTLIAQEKEKSAEVFLTLNSEMDEEQALGLAKMIATGLGNETTDNISIMDSNMNLLYAGGMDGTTMASGFTYSQLSVQQKVESRIKSGVKQVLLGTGTYQDAEVAVNLVLDFADSKTTSKEYSVPEGQDRGYVSEENIYESETNSQEGGVPGTTSNGEDGTYVIDDGTDTTQTISDSSRKYNTNETITETKASIGDIVYEDSSIAVSLERMRKYDEDTLRQNGTLDDMTFDEYRAQIESQDTVVQDVGGDIIALVANATGIAEERIKIVEYEKPVFIPSQGSGRTFTDYLEILLAVLIFALLGFVVFMSTRKEKTEEMEPELSVESLLQTTKENSEEENLEDIGFREKSEATMLIEKFVEEKPEAVAALLHNWLNEDWE